MNHYLKQVHMMHEKFGITNAQLPLFNQEEKRFRATAMLEELEEYESATEPHDELDALVDLAVFLFGTVERQGWSNVFDAAFSEVMKANMQKEVGPNAKRGNFQTDLVKPEGWQHPDLKPLIKQAKELNND